MNGAASRVQLAVYAAIGLVLVLLGIRAVGQPSSGSGEPAGGSAAVQLSGGPVGGDARGSSGSELVVHVAGAVANPGVYRLPAGSRVTDAVERAGGPRGGADPNAINLAAPLADGQQVVVPERVATAASVPGTADPSADAPISLGSATQADLETIDGIGPVTAADIIAFRDENGGISSVEELDAVPGIGPATIQSLSARLQP